MKCKETLRRYSGKTLSVMLAFIMVATAVLTGIGGITEEAYAKAVGKKNEQTCDHCDMVIKGQAPKMKDYSSHKARTHSLEDEKTGLTYGSDGYSTDEVTYEKLLDGAVYRGGNSYSGLQPKNPNANPEHPDKQPTPFDSDHNDFANVLPYGNTYIDTNKLAWGANDDFKIEIADGAPFKWIAGKNYEGRKAKNGLTVETDPMGDGSGLEASVAPVIAYVGPVKGYLGNDEADWRKKSQAAPAEDQENIIDAADLGLEYLYRITYPNAATLKDGTRGNLIITATRVEIETTATQVKAVITLQTANQLSLGAHLKNKNGDRINTQNFVAKTAQEVQTYLDGTGLSGDNWIEDKESRAATGAIIDLDIKVTDAENEPVSGSISYAARDMDLENYQSQWGRSIAGEDRYKFNEAMTIVGGSLSYAVTPYYDHAHETERAKGWIPVRPGSAEVRTSPLHITKTGSGTHADGVRFSGIGNVMLRDKDESFANALIATKQTDNNFGTEIRTALNMHANNADTLNKNPDSYTITDNIKKQLVGKIKAGGANVPANEMTNQQIFDYLGDGSFGDRRGDDGTFDTGFAVLMDASGFKLQWSGSMQNGGNVTTKLFDDSIYTYIEQTHGTGGGIYFETYDIANGCKVNRSEGTVTMGRGTDATVTVVPEDGYRIDTIKVGKKELGDSIDFEVIYDGNNKVKAVKYKDQEHAVTTGNSVTIGTDEGTTKVYGDITFEVNDGGSIDVTLPSVEDPRHIHADFTADYYFYKVWKSKKQDPTSLKLTATPYAYKFKEVTIDNTKYTINGNTFTGGGKSYTLENNVLKVGEEPNVTVYHLEGNDLVSYKHDSNDPDTRIEDKRFTIRLEYEQNGKPVEFEVTKADADNTEETNVIKETDKDGYPVWKIRYPAAGYTTKANKVWPALQIETKPSAHSINHVERNYWFVTEDAPGWALVEYDNSAAETSGVIDRAKQRNEVYEVGSSGHLSAWALSSTKDVKNSGSVIRHASSSNHAYMSVFSDHANAITKHEKTWGGKIVNIPLVVVNAEKTWDDFSNAFNTRQDVWFHIDATIDGTKTKDILPPQKLAATESGNKLTKIWGNKTAYGDSYLKDYAETDVDYSKVKVAGTTAGLPADIYYAQDKSNPHKYIPMVEDGYEEVGGVQVPKYKPDNDGTIYYVNELSGVDSAGKEITYSLRETDAKGNELNKTDVDKYLIGYESEVSDVKKDDEKATLDEVKVDSYTGKVKNTLETVDFEVTKIWEENGATGDGRTHASDDDFTRDVNKLKANYTLNENGKLLADTETMKLQPQTAEAYVPASGDDPASGTLETKKGTDGTEIVFKWHKIPKYVGDVDSEGKAMVREAVYSVVETQLNGYNAPAYDNSGMDAEGKTGETDTAYNKGKITNEVTPPEGTPKQTWGEKDQPQTASGKDMFTVTTETDIEGSPNEIKEVKLIDPKTGDSVDRVTVPEGTYEIDGDGKITFTPKSGFVGNPTPVGVRGTDANGLSADTTYTPHICDTETTVTRTIEYWYANGDPVEPDAEGNPKTVVQTVTFKGIVNPDTGEITYPGNPTETFPEVTSGDITGYTVDRTKVQDETVRPRDKDLFEKVIYSPQGVTATPDRSYGLPNEPQSGTLTFEMETPTYTDESPNELTIKLVDPTTGKEVNADTVPAVDEDGNIVGTYTIKQTEKDDKTYTSTIQFTPNDGYVGNPRPLEVTGTDRFGKKARTTYTPHIVDPVIEDEASRNITYTYLTEDGEEASATITQKVTMKRHASKVNVETGEVEEWGPWEPAEFPAVPNPGHIDEKIWTANKSAQKTTVTEPGPAEDVHVVYTKEPYTVIYHNGDHGKSDGKGNQKGEDYNNDVTGGNGVTPAKGYHFTGKYTYVIKDKTGKVIETGVTNDPKTVKITGNVEFTPIYEPNKYTIKYDANGGKGSMSDQKFTGADSSATSKSNEFTRKGYRFTGFKAKLPDGTYLKDANGNVLIFKDPDDFIEYLHAQGDGGEITLEAQWTKVKGTSDGDDSSSGSGASTGDTNTVLIWIALLAAAALAVIVVIIRRRRE